MLRPWCLVGLALFACTPRAEPAEQQHTARAEDPAEPAPHYKEHPDVPPDELGTPEPRDAGAAPDECPMTEPPDEAPRARIRSGPPVTNYIPPEIIKRPIRARAACFRGCYRAALSRNPELHGRIATRFVIDLDGWVRKVRVVEDELGDHDFADCIRRAFVGLQYPEPEGESVTVVYPLVFQPEP